MCDALPRCETPETVMRRVAGEITAAANDLDRVEACVAGMVEAGQPGAADVVQLQALDRVGQQLRALATFLNSALPCSCGRIDVQLALGDVRLEAVRARLGGGLHGASAAGEAELW
jgi:hypothetical protein